MALTTVTAACRCPLCHDELGSNKEGRLVRCKTCLTPYHRFCWGELGGCSTLGCSNRRRRRVKPTAEPIVAAPAPALEPERAAPRPLPTFNLDDLSIAAPCPAAWDDMQGDARARHCEQCDKTVFDLSELSRAEGEALLTQNGVTPCVRLYQRHDGTVITADCPEGVRLRFLRRLKATGGVIGLFVSVALVALFRFFFVSTMGAPLSPQSWAEEAERQELLDWLLTSLEAERPVTEDERVVLQAMGLEELRAEKADRLLARTERPEDRRSALKVALASGRRSVTIARRVRRSATARAALERADTAFTTAIELQRLLAADPIGATYQRALVRRALCQWDAARADFVAAAKSETHQARATLALALIDLHVIADRTTALRGFEAAESASVLDEDEYLATLLAEGYRTYLEQGYAAGRAAFLKLREAYPDSWVLGEAHGALAYLERSEGEILGAHPHAALGLASSREAVEADRLRLEFQVDHAILLARSPVFETNRNAAIAAQGAAQDLDLDSEWPALVGAIIYARARQRARRDQMLETAIQKARGRSSLAEARARAFAQQLREAVQQ